MALRPGMPAKVTSSGNGDLPLDLLGGGAGKLGEDLDDGRRRIGIGLDVDVEERVPADNRQRNARAG